MSLRQQKEFHILKVNMQLYEKLFAEFVNTKRRDTDTLQRVQQK